MGYIHVIRTDEYYFGNDVSRIGRLGKVYEQTTVSDVTEKRKVWYEKWRKSMGKM